MSPRIRGKNIACAIKERQGECMALLRLPRGEKKESGSRKRDQAAGRRNARSQVIAKHPANLDEGLAISCKVCDCSLIGNDVVIADVSKSVRAFSLALEAHRDLLLSSGL